MKQKIAALALSLIVSIFPAAASAETGDRSPLPVKYSFLDALARGVRYGAAAPAGSNDWSCKPSEQHPRPVVLVHATFITRGINWGALSPLLANEGYCVYALNYGGEPMLGLLGAYGPVEASVAELSDFIDQVLASTGATEVDVVGHSQGGMMPRYYIKNLGGADKVANLVGLSPSNHGSEFSAAGNLMSLVSGFNEAITAQFPAWAQQTAGSDFITELNSGGETDPAVQYTVIQTRYDELVTPWRSSFLAPGPNVKNLTVQDYCWLDFSEHLSIAYDHVALRLVLNALDPTTARKPACSFVAPIFGG